MPLSLFNRVPKTKNTVFIFIHFFSHICQWCCFVLFQEWQVWLKLVIIIVHMRAVIRSVMCVQERDCIVLIGLNRVSPLGHDHSHQHSWGVFKLEPVVNCLFSEHRINNMQQNMQLMNPFSLKPGQGRLPSKIFFRCKCEACTKKKTLETLVHLKLSWQHFVLGIL